MATRAVRTNKNPKILHANDSGRMIVPELVTRDLDAKYMGPEPLFVVQPDSDRRTAALVISFNWYNRFFDKKMAKEQLSNYADYIGLSDLSKKLNRVDDKEVMATLGWLARMHMRGLDLTEIEKSRLDAELTRLVNTLNKPEVVVKEKTVARVNVQEVMREKAAAAGGDLEGLLDEFIGAGAKASNLNVSSVGTLSEKNILPQHIGMLREVWKKKLVEFQEVASGKDPQLNEAYAHYGKNQIKAVIKFVEAVLSGFDSYINIKKANRTPRKRKVVSPEKQVSKIKFQKKFEDAANNINIVSVHPAKIIGASEVWAFDTAKRKMWYLVADSHVGTMGVKGSSIVGFDTAKSGVKTVRKPGELLNKLLSAGKPAARKIFESIKAVNAKPNGRSNENLIILRVH